jgi:hypothetical protein
LPPCAWGPHVGGYTTGIQSEEEEEEAGAGQGTRGGVHYGHTVRGGGEEGRCRVRHTRGGTLRAYSQRRRRRRQGKGARGGVGGLLTWTFPSVPSNPPGLGFRV